MNASLFDVKPSDIPAYGDGKQLYRDEEIIIVTPEPDIELAPSDVSAYEGEIFITATPEPDISPPIVGTPLPDAVPPVSYGLSISTLETAVNALDESIQETYSVNVNLADAYLSSSIVDVFSRVAWGLKPGTHYAAFRTSASDANEGFMIFSDDAEVDGNVLYFPVGSTLAHYYRQPYSSGYQTYYNYLYDVVETTDEYRLQYKSGSLLYTDLVEGFPTLCENTRSTIGLWFVILILALISAFSLFRRR